jgi:hypothetical protein
MGSQTEGERKKLGVGQQAVLTSNILGRYGSITTSDAAIDRPKNDA